MRASLTSTVPPAVLHLLPERLIRRYRAFPLGLVGGKRGPLVVAVGDPAEAMVCHGRALELFRRLKDRYNEADMLTLEAYLVESAVAIGDEQLSTVGVRWELASAALRLLPEIPTDVVAAVALVRTTVVQALGQADGARLARTWIPLP